MTDNYSQPISTQNLSNSIKSARKKSCTVCIYNNEVLSKLVNDTRNSNISMHVNSDYLQPSSSILNPLNVTNPFWN